MSKPQITYDDFDKLDIRVGLIKEADVHPNADKLLVLKVNVGGTDDRTVVAGIKQHRDPAKLIGQTIIVLCNLEPRGVRGVLSNAMLFAASNDAGGFGLLTTDTLVAAGSQVK